MLDYVPPKTHKKINLWSSRFSTAIAPFLCLPFQHFLQKSMAWTLISCPYLPFIVILPESDFQSFPMLSNGSSVDIPNGYFSVHILWDPSCIDLIDQSFLLETLSALLLCPQQAHVFFISLAASHLSHFSLFLILSSLSSGAPHSLTFVFPSS